MNWLHFAIGCMMVFWPTLILIGLYNNVTDEDKKVLIKVSGIIWLGIVSALCTVACIGMVVAWRAF